jgi:phage-related protein
MADDFSIEPSYAIQMDEKTDVKQAGFGDGYSQRAVSGLHSIKTVWKLTWEGISTTNADSLIALFRGRRGVSVILWTPKRAVATASKVTYETNHYVCILTHISETGNAPGNATYWSSSSGATTAWVAGMEYYSGTSTQQKWICSSWSRSFNSNDFDTVTATFERVFDL